MPYNTYTHREQQLPATCVCNRSAPAIAGRPLTVQKHLIELCHI